YQQYEFHKFGVDLKASRDIFLETLDVVERYLGGDPLQYEGKHIHIPETYFSVRPLQRRLDIYIAGLAADPVTQERIARKGYVPFFTTGWSTLEQIKETRDKVAAVHAKVGGDPAHVPFAMQQYIFVTDRHDEALQAADGARYIRRIAMSMRNNVAKLDGAFLHEQPVAGEPPLEELVKLMIIGDAETVAEKLIREFEVLQPTHLSCFIGLPGIPQARTLRSMERFGAEVMPRVAKHFGGLERVGHAPRAAAAAN